MLRSYEQLASHSSIGSFTIKRTMVLLEVLSPTQNRPSKMKPNDH
jgi:hypothetical protein